MSSKGVLDSSEKKDTEKKEIKKEKKEKKEKSKNRDSKDLEKDTVGDENQTEGNDQESSSAKTKKKFGIFRLRGMKSKGSKHGSSDSLTVQSRNSTDFDKSGSEFSLHESSGSAESAAAETAEPSEEIVIDTKKKRATAKAAKLESDVWTGSPKNINPQSFEIVSRSLQSSVIVSEPDQTRAKGDQKGVKLRLEAENVSPSLTVQSRNSTDFDRSRSEFSFQETGGSSKSAAAETSESSDKTVLDMAKLQSDVRTESPENIKAQSLVIERSLQSSAILTESNQTIEKAKEIKEVHDREITRSEEKRVYTVVSTAISNTGYAAGETREEVETETPKKQRVHNQKARPGDSLRDEKPVMQAVSKNKKSQLLEQVDDFLKLEANIKGRSKHQSDSHVRIEKREVKEKIRSVVEEDHKLPQKGIDIVDDPPEKLAPKSSSFDEKTGFTSSTSKRLSIDNKKNTAKEIKNEEDKKMESAKDNKTSSVVKFKLRAQLLNAMKDVKMSSTVLMAQLAEVNKKLKELKEELLKLLDKGIDEPKKASTEDASIQS